MFPDHQLIWSLGCGSVVNLPLILGDELVGTLNVLHEEHFYTNDKVATLSRDIVQPPKLAYLTWKFYQSRQKTA